jgi:hypothetical protein
MARRAAEPEYRPWPRELARFDPSRWSDRQAWRLARAEVARSLGRPVLPELALAVRCEAVRRNLSRLYN